MTTNSVNYAGSVFATFGGIFGRLGGWLAAIFFSWFAVILVFHFWYIFLAILGAGFALFLFWPNPGRPSHR